MIPLRIEDSIDKHSFTAQKAADCYNRHNKKRKVLCLDARMAYSAIETAVKLLINEEIANYRYNNNNQEIIEK